MGSCCSCLNRDGIPDNHPTKFKDLMQCNSINVMEEPVIITRNSHPVELDLSRAPQPPNALGCTISSFANGFPGCPGEGPRFSAPRRPSTSSLRHPSLGEESTHALIAPDEQSHTYVNTPASEDDPRRSRHCLQPLPEGRVPFPSQARGPGPQDPQVFLQPGQVKFVLGPTPVRRHTMKCQGLCPSLRDPPHHNNNEGPSECPAQPKCTYENVSGGLWPGAGWRLSPEEPGWNGLAHRRAALLHYENLPSLPPVWEGHAQRLGEEAGDDGDSRDGLTPSSNGFPDGEEDETPLQKSTSTRAALRSHGSFPVPLTRRRGSPRVFNFDFRRPGPEPPRQLNYIQVELKGWGGDRPKGPQSPAVPQAPVPTTHPARSSDSYAVIDLKKTVAMSNLQRALPRDDGTARKTRHNSTDLPL
nr:PREDICTED: fibroblast growth factor receptor substrate 3 isoform X3 [Rhinolophus sinicus]